MIPVKYKNRGIGAKVAIVKTIQSWDQLKATLNCFRTTQSYPSQGSPQEAIQGHSVRVPFSWSNTLTLVVHTDSFGSAAVCQHTFIDFHRTMLVYTSQKSGLAFASLLKRRAFVGHTHRYKMTNKSVICMPAFSLSMPSFPQANTELSCTVHKQCTISLCKQPLPQLRGEEWRWRKSVSARHIISLQETVFLSQLRSSGGWCSKPKICIQALYSLELEYVSSSGRAWLPRGSQPR